MFSEYKESGQERVLLQIFKNSLCYFNALSFSQKGALGKTKSAEVYLEENNLAKRQYSEIITVGNVVS